MIKHFLCIEHGEKFVIKASSLKEAQEEASMWGGEAVRELTPRELFNSDLDKGEYCIID